MRSCPQCGAHACLMTIRHESGHVTSAVYCADSSCNVNTGFGFDDVPDVIRRWNEGIGLERRDGAPFVYYGRLRKWLAVPVD